MELHLNRLDEAFQLEIINLEKHSVITDAPINKGGGGQGLRPMELILAGLASCSSFDIISILQKSKQPIKEFTVEIQAKRREQIPQIFSEINLIFKLKGKIDEKKLAHAIELSVYKYCSVAEMLKHSTKIHTQYKILS